MKTITEHFDLESEPFGDIRSGSDYLEFKGFRVARDGILEAVDNNRMVAIVGPVGSGKTTALEAAIRQLQVRDFALSQVQALDKERIRIGAIMDALILDLSAQKPRRNNEYRTRQLVQILREESKSRKVCLIIDEAHTLHWKTMRALKALHELRRGVKRMLSIVLVGQLPLKRKLLEYGMEEVGWRVRITDVAPIESVSAYVGHWLKRCGGSISKVFDPKAIEEIGQIADTPLAINYICRRAMQLAVTAGEKRVNPDLVREAATRAGDYRNQLRRLGISVRQVARRCGYSPALVSGVLNGTYKGSDAASKDVMQAVLRMVA